MPVLGSSPSRPTHSYKPQVRAYDLRECAAFVILLISRVCGCARPGAAGPGDAVITGQGAGAGAVAEPAQRQHRVPEAGQRPAARRRAAAALLSGQQSRGELHQFPVDVERGTVGDHVERCRRTRRRRPRRRRRTGGWGRAARRAA